MIYQQKNSMNKIVSNAKRHSTNKNKAYRLKTWASTHKNMVRLSLSNKYFVSLSITHYQTFFPFVWIYFGLVYIAWGISMILWPFYLLCNKIINLSTTTARKV